MRARLPKQPLHQRGLRPAPEHHDADGVPMSIANTTRSFLLIHSLQEGPQRGDARSAPRGPARSRTSVERRCAWTVRYPGGCVAPRASRAVSPAASPEETASITADSSPPPPGSSASAWARPDASSTHAVMVSGSRTPRSPTPQGRTGAMTSIHPSEGPGWDAGANPGRRCQSALGHPQSRARRVDGGGPPAFGQTRKEFAPELSGGQPAFPASLV